MRKRKKTLFHQLENAFNLAFELSCISSFSPDLTQIEALLEDSKDKPEFYDNVRKFSVFLKNLSYSEMNASSVGAVSIEYPPIVRGEAAKTFTTLVKKIQHWLNRHEKKTGSRNLKPFQSASPLFEGVKFNLKTLFGISLINLVLGRPEPRTTPPNFLKKIIESNFYDWSKYYDSINEILNELEIEIKDGNLSYLIKQKIFWFFRNYLGSSEKNIIPDQNQRLYNIIATTLQQQDSELLLLEAEHLSILEDIFIILKALYPYSDKNANIFTLYIDNAIRDKSLSRTKNADKFISQLFNAFKSYLPPGITNELSLMKPLLNLMDAHLVWNENDPVAMLLKALSFLKDIREQSKTNRYLTHNIDRYVKSICEKAIAKIPHQFYLPYPEIWIKEDIGATYMKHLEPSDRGWFDGLYRILTPKDIFPHAETQLLKGVNGAPDFSVTINYDQLLPEKKAAAFKLATEAYRDIEDLKSKLNLVSVQKPPITISINLFNDDYHFERYGYLVFNYDSSGGGICDPMQDLCSPNIYQTFEGFLNFKHEVIHALMMHFLGKNYRHYVSGAFGEGIADWFDKGPLNSNKMNWLAFQFEQGKLKELAEVVTLDEGGSIVYAWGYFWLKYMLEEDNTYEVGQIFRTIQTADKTLIDSAIKDYANNKQVAFKSWLKKLKTEYIRPPLDTQRVQKEYLQLLKNAPDLEYLIKQNKGQIRFEFADGYVYTLEIWKISCAYIYKNSGNVEAAQELDYSRYEWFKRKLLNAVIGLSTDDSSLSSISVPQDELYLKGIIAFISQQDLDPRKRALLEGEILNYAQKIYRQDLTSNSDLRNFLRQVGSTKFTFANTVFVLSVEDIRRYSSSGTSQAIYVSDYRWFKSALEIFVMQKQLENSTIDRNLLISDLLKTNEHYVTDRLLSAVSPGMDNNLQGLIQSFVFYSASGLSTEFKNCFAQKTINIDTLQQIIVEQLEAPTVKPSNSLATTINPWAITSVAINTTHFILNVAGSNNTGLINHNNPDANHSNIPNWVIPLVSTLSVVTSVAVGVSFWCWKKNQTKDKKSDLTSNAKESNRPLILQIPPASNQRQSKFW
ncbi:MAG: hypothetical protein WAL30_07155 [Candidatus Aquirickettsiella sp.]